MTTLMSHGEDIRKAVKWISEERQGSPEKKLAKLVEEASVKFNLSPADYEPLLKLFKVQKA